jgi:GTP-binding protein Era
VTSRTIVRSGLVAVVGRPNVGKSTLVNALIGHKVSIVSDKPQTTRRGLRAVLTTNDVQAVFTDTPGSHKPRTELGARLNQMVGDAVEGVDVILHVLDAAAGIGRGDAAVYERWIRPHPCPSIAVVNKIDATGDHGVVPQLAAAGEIGDYAEIVPVSAEAGTGIDELRSLVLGLLPEGPALYPEETISDQPFETRLAEMIREKALQVTRQELPHSVTVVVEEVEVDGGLTTVHASLIVERDSQKGIVIGRGGRTLRTIGSRAREEMELVLATKVFLDLRVKVVKEWQRDPKALERLGF